MEAWEELTYYRRLACLVLYSQGIHSTKKESTLIMNPEGNDPASQAIISAAQVSSFDFSMG